MHKVCRLSISLSCLVALAGCAEATPSSRAGLDFRATSAADAGVLDVSAPVPAEVDFFLNDGPPIQTRAITHVTLKRGVVGAASQPAEAFFVRCDRTTMSESGLEREFDALAAEFPNACDRTACELDFRLDERSGTYGLEGEPGQFVVGDPTPSSSASSGDPEWRYVPVRRISA